MKFKVDENLPIEARDDLRNAGHDAVTVADQQLAGQPDAQVAGVCRTEGRAVLTWILIFRTFELIRRAITPALLCFGPQCKAYRASAAS